MKKLIFISIILLLNIIIPANKVKASEVEVDKQTRVIEDGIYEIETKIDSTKVVDIAGGSLFSRANVHIWERANVYQQRFKFTYEKGYYTIQSVKSGKVLDVDNAGIKNGTNVQQFTSNSTPAQKWRIEKTEDGYYTIISKCNNLALTISGSQISNGTNIEVNENKNLENQKFALKKVTTIKGTKTIEEGVYTISTALDKNKVLDIAAASVLSGANVQIWLNCDVDQQKFYLEYNDGYYTIRNLKSGKVLDVKDANIQRGTNVQQFTSNSTDAQKWVIKETEDGYYNIISKCSGIFLDVAGSNTMDGTNVQINLGTGTKNQKFLFNKIEYKEERLIEDGIYEITTKLASNMLVDIAGGSSSDGANVQIWADANEKQQKFKVTYVKNSLYKIICERSGKALTVSSSGTNYSSNVYQSTYKESKNQLWKIIKSDIDGYYYIKSAYNERYLDVQNGTISNGTNLRVYVPNYSNAQKFIFEQKIYGIDVSHWQNEIDFQSLYNADKIDFMIIRAGQGTTIKDRQFENNYIGTKKYNIPVGVYLYATAQSVEEARAEANYLLELLKGKTFELPVFYDVEAQESLSTETITQMCIEFYNIIKNAGYNPGIYASKYYLMSKINVNQLPKDCTIWVASYGKNNGTIPSDTYRYNGDFDIWQYTSTGSISGIKGDVDCNVSYKLKI